MKLRLNNNNNNKIKRISAFAILFENSLKYRLKLMSSRKIIFSRKKKIVYNKTKK